MATYVRKLEFSDSTSEMGRIGNNWEIVSSIFDGFNFQFHSILSLLCSFGSPFPSLSEVFFALIQHPVPLEQPDNSLSMA